MYKRQAYRGKAMADAASGIDCGMTAVLNLDRVPLAECCEQASALGCVQTVSYTHLDVYKRQACSNAGALGIIGAGGMNTDTLRENIRRCKQLTDCLLYTSRCV